MKRSIPILISAIAISGALQAQCDFFDDYSTNSGWTQIGTEVEVINGHLEFVNGAKDGEGPGGAGQKRVHKSIGNTLNAANPWFAEFEFTPTSVGTNSGQPWTGHNLLALTAGTQEPLSNCPDIPCSGFPTGTQDGVMVYYGSPNPPNGAVFFQIIARDNSTEFFTPSQIMATGMGITYYPRLERTSATSIQLSVFSDAARTIQMAGSPIALTIPSTITGLNTVQHGNVVRGNYQRQLTGSIDDLCINFHGVSDGSNVKLESKLKLFPNPTSGQFNIDITENIENTSIEVYDIMGKNIFTSNNIRDKRTNINITDQPKGIYLIKVTVGNEVFNEKIVYQ